jgi:hypothetical protein
LRRLVCGADVLIRRTHGRARIGCGTAETFGFRDGLAEVAQGLIAQRGRGLIDGKCFVFSSRRFRFNAADRVLERSLLAFDLVLAERRLARLQLLGQRGARAFVKRVALLTGIVRESPDCA